MVRHIRWCRACGRGEKFKNGGGGWVGRSEGKKAKAGFKKVKTDNW
jgi:hypothetical protein